LPNWSWLEEDHMGSLPVAILYSFFVEHYVASMTGAVKE
jgi:multiple sugar transport system permease protein